MRHAPGSARAYYADSSGAAALEFAILCPVFLLLAIGMIAYAIYFGAAHSVQQLAADAARVSIGGLSTTERSTLVGTFLDNNAGGYVLIDRKPDLRRRTKRERSERVQRHPQLQLIDTADLESLRTAAAAEQDHHLLFGDPLGRDLNHDSIYVVKTPAPLPKQ